ncbi:short-chain dehydrogenase/reductase SDR [Planctomyces bekefii]|uniref:Short-chain dehydrogenase/reductase SDR n=1 Tax=Planctomyces bekefii TaxID=1653850 RepID=A0A5C6M5D1_9PLAN|nr:short-chain dehydrogenase/reductase SDR [Planctomyces bekefii]
MDNYIAGLFDLSNKVVVITGANGQLGRELVMAYTNAGSIVIGWDLSLPKIEVDNVKYIQVDVSKKEGVIHALEESLKINNKIDVFINNAGVSTFEPFEQRPEEKIDWVMDVNLKGTLFCIQGIVNLVDKLHIPPPNIINIGSFYGVISPDFRIYEDGDRKNSEIYGATKAGVIQMTKYFAVHLAERNIRVNAVSPGGIYNPSSPQSEEFVTKYSFRCPMKRMANVEEITGAILYLSSRAASYTTGQNIIIDGGMSCW